MPSPSAFGSHGRRFSPFLSPRDRVDQFRSMHRLGERVAGRFSHWEGRGLGWVDFPSGPLLASMASSPKPGTRLYFLVKQLFPDIVLQEVFPQDRPGTIDLLQRFWIEQGRLETRLGQLASPAQVEFLDFRDMADAFRQALDSDPELGRELEEAFRIVQAINAELAKRSLGRYVYLPWLTGHVRCAGLLLPPSQGTTSPETSAMPPEALFVCIHPLCGNMEIHLALARTPPGFTVFLEHAEHQSSLGAWLDQWFARTGEAGLVFLGIRPLPGGLPSGALARLLLPCGPSRMGLHIQV